MDHAQLEMFKIFGQTASAILELEIISNTYKELLISRYHSLIAPECEIYPLGLVADIPRLEPQIGENKRKNLRHVQDIITYLELTEKNVQKVQKILNDLHVASQEKVEKIEEAFKVLWRLF